MTGRPFSPTIRRLCLFISGSLPTIKSNCADSRVPVTFQSRECLASLFHTTLAHLIPIRCFYNEVSSVGIVNFELTVWRHGTADWEQTGKAQASRPSTWRRDCAKGSLFASFQPLKSFHSRYARGERLFPEGMSLSAHTYGESLIEFGNAYKFSTILYMFTATRNQQSASSARAEIGSCALHGWGREGRTTLKTHSHFPLIFLSGI